MDFTELKLKSELQQTLSRMNYTTLTPIQERCIPPLLAGESLIAQSRTGSGKTLAYALPLLEKIRFETFLPQALILVPTRELALQVKQTLDNVGMYCRTRHLLLIGRQPFRFQREDLKQRTHVIIATPGRLLQHTGRNGRSFRSVHARDRQVDEMSASASARA
ncbi:MAG: DEAD/DEAH box helicase [Merdibacter sp.]